MKISVTLKKSNDAFKDIKLPEIMLCKSRHVDVRVKAQICLRHSGTEMYIRCDMPDNDRYVLDIYLKVDLDMPVNC